MTLPTLKTPPPTPSVLPVPGVDDALPQPLRPGALWDGAILTEGARRLFEQEGKGASMLRRRLEALRQKAREQKIEHPVREPFFPIDPELVARFRKQDACTYWKAALADSQVEQNAIPLPAYSYQEADYPKFIAPVREIRTAVTTAMELTLAGLAFEEEELLERGLAVWRDMVAWKPGGFCDDWHGDMLAASVTLRLIRVALWQKERLSTGDWQALGAMLEWRFRETHELMVHFAIDRYPYDSHVIHAAALFAAGVIATEPYFPALQPFRDWVREVIEPQFPIWGGDDGGWAAGVSYWKWSATDWLLLADAYPGGHPLRSHPWVRNTGWFKFYAHPAHSRQGAFGDHGDIPPGPLDASLLRYLGALHREPRFIWYADEALANQHGVADPGPEFVEVEGLALDLAAFSTRLTGTPPAPRPCARHFADAGLIAAHTAPGDPLRNRMLLFRCSRWGSFNHAHADQNSFVIESGGEPLLIDAGYYPNYHHPHQKKFSIQTAAHNALLVNGIGQTIRNLHSRGKIVAYRTEDDAVTFTGDATEAYGGRCRKVLRHLRFEMGAETPFLILMDEVETDHPHVTDWMLHSYEPMEINEAERTILVTGHRGYGGRARALVHLLTPQEVYWKQSDEFPAPTDHREIHKPKQWHLQVTPRFYTSTTLILATLQLGDASTRWSQPFYDPEQGSLTLGSRSFLVRPGHGIDAATA
ncbi:MAG TPA: heparinase II/III-family protein [Chthoniobacteraceae bacterium]|nr:heparinase II/III-family protein [Chthoniobacteraceae bacterium]